MERETYKVGEVVIGYSRYHGYSRTEVERVTKTQAILKTGQKLRIGEVNGGSEIGSSGWNTSTFKKETPELKEKVDLYLLQKDVRKGLEEIKVEKLSTVQLNHILSCLNTLSASQ